MRPGSWLIRMNPSELQTLSKRLRNRLVLHFNEKRSFKMMKLTLIHLLKKRLHFSPWEMRWNVNECQKSVTASPYLLPCYAPEALVSAPHLFVQLFASEDLIENMSDGDVFAKLSRILETHAFTTDDKAIDRLINDYINDDAATPFPETQDSSFDG